MSSSIFRVISRSCRAGDRGRAGAAERSARRHGDLGDLGAPGEEDDPDVVKMVGGQISPNRLRALYFTRARAPFGEGPYYHHLGVYAFRRAAFERFVGLPVSPLEKRERLEQLRALEDGMRIDAALLDKAGRRWIRSATSTRRAGRKVLLAKVDASFAPKARQSKGI